MIQGVSNVLEWLLWISFAAYIPLIVYFSIGLFKSLNSKKSSTKIPSLKVSVLIPFRNEAENIVELIDSIKKQSLNTEKWELILIDDHSTDEGWRLAQEQILYFPAPAKLIKNKGKGKKEAIRTGVYESTYEWIQCFDADISPGPNVLQSMLSVAEKPEIKLVLGPVKIKTSNGVFSKLQALEFSSLVASAAGAARMGKPIMGNAANLLFEKQSYLQFYKHDSWTSGDDMLLMQAIQKSKGAKAISFNLDPQALVETQAEKTFYGFINQRARWVSKAKAYRNLFVLATASVVFLVNFALVIISMGLALGLVEAKLVLWAFVIKMLTDMPLLFGINTFFSQLQILPWMIPLAIIYPYYVCFSAFRGLLRPFNWKGRKAYR